MGDTLELPVSVTDGFSAPLKKLIAQLQGVKPPEGLKQTATHFEALRTHVTQASSSIGRDFSTAMSGLGVTSLGAVASIAAVSSAVKRFSEGTIELRQFERATGVATETLRRFQKAAPEFGVAGDAVQSSLRTFASKFQGQFKRGLGLSDLYSAGEGELAGKIRNSTTIEEALRAGLDAAAENAKRGDPQRGQRILDALGLSGLHNFTVRGKGALDEVFNRKFSPLTTDDEKRAIEFERAVIKINDAFDKVSKTIAIGMTGPITNIMNQFNGWAESGGLAKMVDGFKNVGLFAEQAATAIGTVRQAVDDISKSPFGKFLSEADKGAGDAMGGFVGFLRGLIGKTSYGGAGGFDANDAGVRTVHAGVLGAMREFAGLGGDAAGGGDARIDKASYGGGGAARAMRGIRERMGLGDNVPSGGGGNPGAGTYPVSKAYELIKRAGGTDEEARVLAAISQAESRGNPRAFNGKGRDQSYGLWQINMLGKMGPDRRRRFGLTSNEDLFDPETNARVALAMKRAGRGYQDWTTFTSGRYRPYLAGARGDPSAAQGGQSLPRGGYWAKDGYGNPVAVDAQGRSIQSYRSGSLLDAGKGAGVVGSAPQSRDGDLRLSIDGLPSGWKARAQGKGLFRDIDVSMGKPLSASGEDI